MNESERRAYHNSVRLTNVGRCPQCGARCQLPCAVCTHPRRVAAARLERARELIRRRKA